MFKILRTNSENPDFIKLVQKLDLFLAEIDGDDHSFYKQFNTIHALKNVVIAFEDGIAVGCGAMKEIQPGVIEIKRMYTLPEYRGRGVASIILEALEDQALEMNMKKCLLETGIRQNEAIRLYEKSGYESIENYGQYMGIKTSLCFQKLLK